MNQQKMLCNVHSDGAVSSLHYVGVLSVTVDRTALVRRYTDTLYAQQWVLLS